MARTTSDAVEIIRKMFGNDPQMEQLMQEAAAAMDIGQEVFDAREALALTQEALASKVGVTADEIDAIEMGDFQHVPLDLLERIAVALNKRLEIRMAFTDRASVRRTA